MTPAIQPIVYEKELDDLREAGQFRQDAITNLQARVKQLELDRDRQAIKIEQLIEFMAGLKMLMALSIGGGGLSVITLILTISGINK